MGPIYYRYGAAVTSFTVIPMPDPMVEVRPAWYWRLWHALTPWRVRWCK